MDIEHYVVDLNAVSVLELAIRPDLPLSDATAAFALPALLRDWRETLAGVCSHPKFTFRNRRSPGTNPVA